MNWEDTDEDTVMHIMGYRLQNQSIWTLPIFREAVVEYELDIQTLLYLANSYIRRWRLTSEIEAISDYLEFMLNREKKKLGVD